MVFGDSNSNQFETESSFLTFSVLFRGQNGSELADREKLDGDTESKEHKMITVALSNGSK